MQRMCLCARMCVCTCERVPSFRDHLGYVLWLGQTHCYLWKWVVSLRKIKEKHCRNNETHKFVWTHNGLFACVCFSVPQDPVSFLCRCSDAGGCETVWLLGGAPASPSSLPQLGLCKLASLQSEPASPKRVSASWFLTPAGYTGIFLLPPPVKEPSGVSLGLGATISLISPTMLRTWWE
jgi:hypothetical protein